MTFSSFYNSKSKVVKLGIIVSLVWALIVGFKTYQSTTEHALHMVDWSYKVCLENQSSDFSKCDAEKIKNNEIWMKNRTVNAFFAATLPLPLFWLYAFILIYLFKIFRSGFKSEVEYQTLNGRGKFTVVFLVATTGLTLLIAVLWVGNMYTDTKVPVGLSQGVDMTFDNYADNKQITAVYMSGTWEARTGNGEQVKMAYPLQTSKIECYKEKMECMESRAEVSENSLMSELLTYRIEKWTDTEVIFTNLAMCAKATYSANLVTKRVTGINEKVESKLKICKGSPEEYDERYQLVSGFDVYWREHQQARPWFVKSIQGLFGNG